MVFPSAKKAGWQDFKIINAGIPTEYAFNASMVAFFYFSPNSPLSKRTLIIISGKKNKTKEAGIEKNNPIWKDVNNWLENCFIFFEAIDLDSDVNKDVLKAMPIIPKGNWAILSAK